ncbi:hypothetical protein [Thermopirellula anaerolimosa]
MGEQIAGVLALVFDHPWFEVVQPFVVVGKPLNRREPFGRTELPRYVKIEVRVDAVLLELEDEIVQPVQHLRIDGQFVGTFAPDVAVVHVVHPHAVDAEGGQSRGQTFGFLLGGKAGLETKIGGPKPNETGVRGEVAVLNADEAMLARRLFQHAADIRERVARFVAQDEGEESVRGVVLLLGPSRRSDSPSADANGQHEKHGNQDSRLHGNTFSKQKKCAVTRSPRW